MSVAGKQTNKTKQKNIKLFDFLFCLSSFLSESFFNFKITEQKSLRLHYQHPHAMFGKKRQDPTVSIEHMSPMDKFVNCFSFYIKYD